MLAVVKGIEPRDQVEAMLAAQMAAVHIRDNDVRASPGACRKYPATGQRPKRLQQARQDVRRAGRGAQAIPIEAASRR